MSAPRPDVKPSQISSDFDKWTLGRGQADPLRLGVSGAGDQVREPLEREREVDAALGRGEGVDLVDDDGVDRGQPVARLAREHQVQRLRRGDQDLAGLLALALALLGRGIPGADVRRDLRPGAEPLEARERRPQVALDVVRERLDRGHVDHAGAVRGAAHELIEAPQERRERLAAAGRRQHQRVLAARDARPAARLDRRRRGEALAKPRAGRIAERRQRVSGHA